MIQFTSLHNTDLATALHRAGDREDMLQKYHIWHVQPKYFPYMCRLFKKGQPITSLSRCRIHHYSPRLAHAKVNSPRHDRKTASKPSQARSSSPSKAAPYEPLNHKLAKRELPTLLYQSSSYRPVNIFSSPSFR